MAGGDNFSFLVNSYVTLNAEAPSFVPTHEISAASLSHNNVDLVLEKNDVEAGTDTQVRWMEKAKGGIKYDLVLLKSLLKVRNRSPARKSTFSVKRISDRLRTMEDHSTALDPQKINFVDQISSINDNTEKDEIYSSFIRKMESSKENKDAYLKSIQDKARDSKIFEVKKYGESLQIKELNELVGKLRTAMITERKINNMLKERLEQIEQLSSDLLTRTENIKECKCSYLSEETVKETMQQIQKKITEHDICTTELVEKRRKQQQVPKSENATENFIASLTTGFKNTKNVKINLN